MYTFILKCCEFTFRFAAQAQLTGAAKRPSLGNKSFRRTNGAAAANSHPVEGVFSAPVSGGSAGGTELVLEQPGLRFRPRISPGSWCDSVASRSASSLNSPVTHDRRETGRQGALSAQDSRGSRQNPWMVSGAGGYFGRRARRWGLELHKNPACRCDQVQNTGPMQCGESLADSVSNHTSL